MPGGEGLPGVLQQQLARHVPPFLDGCVGDEGPDGDHEGHPVVRQEGPHPAEAVPPGPRRLDPQGRLSRASVDVDGSNTDATRLPYLLECRPHSEFNYETGRNKLINLSMKPGSEPGLMFTVPGDTGIEDGRDGISLEQGGRQNQLLRLSSMINMDDRSTIGWHLRSQQRGSRGTARARRRQSRRVARVRGPRAVSSGSRPLRLQSWTTRSCPE